jgi:hypothetical protein
MGDRKKYFLANPFINGTMKKEYSSKHPIKAAYKAFNYLSGYFSNSVPEYLFSLRDESYNLYHFNVTEKRVGDKVNYTITELTNQLSADLEKKFISELKKVEQQEGGKKHKHKDDDSSSSSSSSSSSDYKLYVVKPVQPVSYYWYNAYLYQPITPITSVYVPSFTVPLSPYIRINIVP